MMFRGPLLAIALFLITLTGESADSVIVPPGFSVSTIPIPGVTNITDIEWAPDNSQRLFIACQIGDVRIVKRGVLLPTPFVRIGFDTPAPLYTWGECGLIGMCFDPGFLSNGYLYLFVTTPLPLREMRILRYQAIGDLGTNRLELIRSSAPGSIHYGGGIAVGPDGRLHLGVGELSGHTLGLAGKIGRINLDGTAPPLNPSGLAWASGFRNPFRICFQPETGSLWVNVAGSDYEQIFLVNRADNAGWYPYENNQPTNYITPRIKYRTGRAETNALVAVNGAVRTNNIATFTTITNAHGFRKGEKITIAGVADPSFNGADYVYSTPSPRTFTFRQPGPDASSGGGTATTLHIGNVVTGGSFYNSTAFPPEYHGNYFFCDSGGSRIMRATLDSSNEVSSVDYFVSGITSVIDVATAPDGALYCVGYSEGDPRGYTGSTPVPIYRLVHTNIPQTIIISPKTFFMAEGGVGMCNVSLARAPATDITVTVTRNSGSGAINTTNDSLTFTPENFAVPQPVYFHAAADSDLYTTRVTFLLSALGMDDQQVNIRAFDRDGGVFRFTSVSRSNAITRLELAAEPRMRVALESSTNLLSWRAVTNATLEGESVTFFDTRAGSASHQFYRAAPVR